MDIKSVFSFDPELKNTILELDKILDRENFIMKYIF